MYDHSHNHQCSPARLNALPKNLRLAGRDSLASRLCKLHDGCEGTRTNFIGASSSRQAVKELVYTVGHVRRELLRVRVWQWMFEAWGERPLVSKLELE